MVIESNLMWMEQDYVLLTLQQRLVAIYIFRMPCLGRGVYFKKIGGKFWRRRKALGIVPCAQSMPHAITRRPFTGLDSHTHITHKGARALGTEKLGLKKWKRPSSSRDTRVLDMSMLPMDICVGRHSEKDVFQLDSSAENSSSYSTLGNTVFSHR